MEQQVSKLETLVVQAAFRKFDKELDAKIKDLQTFVNAHESPHGMRFTSEISNGILRLIYEEMDIGKQINTSSPFVIKAIEDYHKASQETVWHKIKRTLWNNK